MSAQDLVEIRDLTFGYGDGRVILDNISLRVPRGRCIVLPGPPSPEDVVS